MATDRLKTTEELARDERDRLIKLEVWKYYLIVVKGVRFREVSLFRGEVEFNQVGFMKSVLCVCQY